VSVTRALIRCDEAQVPQSVLQAHRSVEKTILTRGSSPSLNLRAQNLVGTVLRSVERRAADLVRIASYIYAADQQVSRGGPADVYGDKWRRVMTLCIPVDDPDFWNQGTIRTLLGEILSYLTNDSWHFHFSRAPEEFRQIALNVGDTTLMGDPDCVVLFSGGADSLCTAVEAAVEGRRPVLVSHRPAPNIDARQARLTARLRQLLGCWGFPHLGFSIHRMGPEPADSSQRSRAFLYASLGAAVASELSVPDVLLGDNGIVSLNLPITAQLVGALASRSTHPRFIRLMNELVCDALPSAPRLSNPLEYRTRAEALAILRETRTASLLAETNSCSRARGRPSAIPHCGYCSQCVDRRFGSLAAGLEEHDSGERYGLDIVTQSLPEGEARTIAESYIRFARDLRGLDDDEALFNLYPQLFDCIDYSSSSPENTANQLVQMVKRHARSVLDTLSEMVRRHSEGIVGGEVEEDSLIRLAAGGGSRPTEPEQSGYIFRREGPTWTVVYGGKAIHLRPLGGFEHIARLLSHPGRGFTAMELSATDTDPDLRVEPSRAAAEGLRTTKLSSADDVLDQTTIDELRGRAKELEMQLDATESTPESTKAVTLQNELESIRAYLRTQTRPGGQARKFSDDNERARQSVSKLINRCLDEIQVAHPDLGRHLRAFLKIGLVCSYNPDPPITWST